MRLRIASWSVILCALLLFLIGYDSGATKIAITSGRDIELKEASNHLQNSATDGHILTNIIQAEEADAKINNKHTNIFQIAYDSVARKIAITSGRDIKLKEASNDLQNFATDGHILTNSIQAEEQDAKINNKHAKKDDEEDEDEDDDDSDDEDEEDDDSDDEDENYDREIPKKIKGKDHKRVILGCLWSWWKVRMEKS